MAGAIYDGCLSELTRNGIEELLVDDYDDRDDQLRQDDSEIACSGASPPP